MLCHIYRSNKKTDTFLYLAAKDDFSEVPEELLVVFGEPQYSFSFELDRDRKLSKEESGEVLQNLTAQGYHLQLKGDLTVEQMLALKSLN